MDQGISKQYGSAQRPAINTEDVLSMVMTKGNAIMVES